MTDLPADRANPSAKARKDAIINLRLSEQTRELIDAAADSVGKTRTQFVLDSAQRHALDVLLNKVIFRLDSSTFEAFVSALDQPPPPNDKLKRLMSRKAPWET
ncbi:DUF1778 domain-containing protein [soil metagenome]